MQTPKVHAQAGERRTLCGTDHGRKRGARVIVSTERKRINCKLCLRKLEE